MKRMLLTVAVLALNGVCLLAQIWGRTETPLVDGRDVTFRLNAPKAEEVKVYGDFLPGVDGFGLGGNAAMEKGEDGVWTYTARNLAPDFYFYYFDVDGVKTLDPSNLKVVHNFAEHLNSFIIRGEESRLVDFSSDKKGSLTQQWYFSSVIGCERRMNVYLPYGYSADKEYDVFYLQHGGGDDEETWVDMGRVCQILDNMIAEGLCKPMIVVLPNSFDNQMAAMNLVSPIPGTKAIVDDRGDLSSDRMRRGGMYTDDFVQCIIPFVESHFAVKRGRNHRAVSGLSMGGGITLYMMEKYPELASYWCVMGSGLWDGMDGDTVVGPLKKTGYDLLWVGCGSTDMTRPEADRLMESLRKNQMPYVFYDSQDGHNWRSWRRNLIDILPRLF